MSSTSNNGNNDGKDVQPQKKKKQLKKMENAEEESADKPEKPMLRKDRQQQAAKKKQVAYIPGTVTLQILGTGSNGSPASVYLFTDQSRYLFNCGEGAQRLAHEHRTKLARLEQIFVTRNTWPVIGGIPGLALTIQDAGVRQLALHGPPHLDNILLSMKRFVTLKTLQLRTVDCTESVFFEDSVMTVQSIPLYRSPNVSLQSKDTISPEESVTISFICNLKPRAGTLNLHKCVAQGVPPGPLLGLLKSGVDVELENGKVVNSSDVSEPDENPISFLFIDIPSHEFLWNLVKHRNDFVNTKIYDDNTTALPVVVHFSPPEVIASQQYQSFLDQFAGQTQHMFLNSSLNTFSGYISAHRLQFQLNLLNPRVFPILTEASNLINNLSSKLRRAKLDDREGENGPSCSSRSKMKKTKVEAREDENGPSCSSKSKMKQIKLEAGEDENGPSCSSKSKMKQTKLEANEDENGPSCSSSSSKMKKTKLEESENDNGPSCSSSSKMKKTKLEACENENGPSCSSSSKLKKTEQDACENDNVPSCSSKAAKAAPLKTEPFERIISNLNTMSLYHLRPRAGLDRSAEVKLQPHVYIREKERLEDFPPLLEKLKKAYAERAYRPATSLVIKYPIITFLGTGSCVPNKTRNVSSILIQSDIDSYVLLDCGEGTMGQIQRMFGNEGAKEVLANLKIIYISHLHADHHIGLIGLLTERLKINQILPGAGAQKILVMAPRQIEPWLNFYQERIFNIKTAFDLLGNAEMLDAPFDVAAEYPYIGIDCVQTCMVKHCQHAYGVKLTMKAKESPEDEEPISITYSGDTMPCQDLIDLGMNTTVLIHEATMENDLEEEAKQKTHSTISQAIQQGRFMQAKYVILTHFSQRYAKLPRLQLKGLGGVKDKDDDDDDDDDDDEDDDDDDDDAEDGTERSYGELMHNVSIAFDNMQICLEDLRHFHLMYPALHSLFAEHAEALEQRALKREQRQERKRKLNTD